MDIRVTTEFNQSRREDSFSHGNVLKSGTFFAEIYEVAVDAEADAVLSTSELKLAQHFRAQTKEENTSPK